MNFNTTQLVKRFILCAATTFAFSLCALNVSAQDNNEIYSFIKMEQPPTYPGGVKKFYEFLGSTMKYPKEALNKNIQGTVALSFVVEKDGQLADFEIIREPGYGTGEEAVRVMKLSKKWNPGQIEGKPVRVKYTIPIKFSLGRR